VPAYVNGLDIVLHASRWEGLPRALVQGLLTEIPGISFDNDGAPEVVTPGETGYLVPLGDVERLADAIVKLAADARLRRDMGVQGRARCLDKFDWRRMVEKIEVLYDLLAQPRTDGSIPDQH
jgi:glycosyltransferase involved in cell wall biosynthesis